MLRIASWAGELSNASFRVRAAGAGVELPDWRSRGAGAQFRRYAGIAGRQGLEHEATNQAGPESALGWAAALRSRLDFQKVLKR